MPSIDFFFFARYKEGMFLSVGVQMLCSLGKKA